MKPRVQKVAGSALACFAWVLLSPAVVSAHERFIRHDLKQRMQDWFFRRDPGGPLGMHPDMFHIGILVTVLLAVLLGIWFLRESLDQVVRYKVLARLRGGLQRALHDLAAFITDKPVRRGWFYSLGEWSVIMFLRAPALVLMYSATNDSLVMPSYPLEPSSAVYFKFLQALLAVLILTQTLLPLCGALVVGTWLYLFRWGPFVAADALPVVTVAVVYLTAPWQSHKLAITRLNPEQARWVRIILGFGFLVLGWMKVYNHDLTAGVADNYPAVMNDPLVAMFAAGTDPSMRRETWVVSFGMAEVMSGFMLMTGIFTRFWACMMLWVFTKLMIVDFGWDEIPHIYPIGALLAVLTSNDLRTEFDLVQKLERGMRGDRPARRLALVAVTSVVIAVVAIFPILWGLTFTDRSMLRQ
ncbi:MAG TPA: DoxX family membrane protein [Vicinamibacteria bacterium]|nr:DoxX family membrane protein [Vicinamibacteria bacterium]